MLQKIFECNFDSESIFENQCGGIETKIVPPSSLADLSLFKNELVFGSFPAISVTDFSSISKCFFDFMWFHYVYCSS